MAQAGVADAIVGREAEPAAIAAFVDAADGPRALLLEGEPGIGKTTLWRAGVDLKKLRVSSRTELAATLARQRA